MIAVGASTWQYADAAWGGSVEAGFFPGESLRWQLLGYLSHSPAREGSRPGVTTLGAEVLWADAERRLGQGLRFSLSGSVGALRYAEDSAHPYYHGWRATLGIGGRAEVWASSKLGLFGNMRFLLPFAGQGSADDLTLLFAFGIAWRG